MLHFSDREFSRRRKLAEDGLAKLGLDGLLVFSPESQYWLTGYDTFGYCFFQCLVVGGPEPALLTRSADLRQAQLTSLIKDIRVWRDAQGANPAEDLKSLLRDLGLEGKTLGIETDTHGLTGLNHERVRSALDGFANLVEASALISDLRLVKSEEEMNYVRKAAELTDDAFDEALRTAGPGADESAVLAAMQGAILAGGGDYPGNEFIIGSGEHALLCRYHSGRRRLSPSDQLTLEWAGVYRHYHCAMMRTLVIGPPDQRHVNMHEAAAETLASCESELRPGAEMGAVFRAHAETLDRMGFGGSRLNACGYSLGARFSPSWMERQMFFEGASTVMAPGMVFFLHMILMDSGSGKAMTLGRTSVVTESGSEALSRHGLDLVCL